MTIEVLSVLMILVGAIFLFVSFPTVRNIRRNVSGGLRRKWLAILYLMAFFIFGYIFFDVILISNLPFPVEFVTAAVFLGGACFVYIIIHISQSTIAMRQEIEEAIALAKKDWEGTFDAVTDIITVHDIDFNIIRANPAAKSMFGSQIQEGMPFAKCFRCYHGTERPPSGCPSCETLKTGKPSTFEIFEPYLNRHLEIRAMPRFGRDHQLIGLIHVVRDITERRQAENALRESEERFRLITETIDEAFWVSDVETKTVTYVSPAYERVWGYPRKNLYEDRKSFRNAVHPDDLQRTLETLAIMETGQPLDHEYRIIHSDGSIRQIWDRGFPIPDETGRVKRYVGVAQDVTAWRSAEKALKESKEYLNQIINSIGDPIFVKDRKHRMILVNDALCAFTGMQREDLLGASIAESMPEKSTISLWDREEDVFNSGRESLTEDNLTDGQGNPRTVMAKKSLLMDKSGNRQIVGVLRDITEYKHLEAQFRQAQKMETVGILAGGVAHDFNNLLNVINGYSELLLADLAPDNSMRGDLEQILDAGKRAATLTSQLLAFGRKQLLQPEIINLNTVVTEMSIMLRRLIGENIELISFNQPDLGLVSADHGQIQQIVMNLAVNARDAMPQGGKLSIEAANVDCDEGYAQRHPLAKSGPYVMLAISDTGAGMDKETQAHIFEPFFTTKEKGRGTGLGLSTVYGIVMQSNGFIWVYSEPGKGTTFKIYFPRVEAGTVKLTILAKSDPGLHGSETVLVVEDDASVRALTCRILRDRGYNLIEATDGMEALRLVQEFAGEIHLVVTDVVMPGINGPTLVDRLEAVRPGIKAVFVSGYADNPILHPGILDPQVAFLQKPFSADALLSKIRSVIGT